MTPGYLNGVIEGALQMNINVNISQVALINKALELLYINKELSDTELEAYSELKKNL